MSGRKGYAREGERKQGKERTHGRPLLHVDKDRKSVRATIRRAQGRSSVGRAAVSKTVGRGFESLRPCSLRREIRLAFGERPTPSREKWATRPMAVASGLLLS